MVIVVQFCTVGSSEHEMKENRKDANEGNTVQINIPCLQILLRDDSSESVRMKLQQTNLLTRNESETAYSIASAARSAACSSLRSAAASAASSCAACLRSTASSSISF